MNLLLRRSTLIAFILLGLIGSMAAALVAAPSGDKTITAYFDETPGLYAGDPVRVLGVDVGRVAAIDAEPGRVKVVLNHDPEVDVPAGASAVIIAPTLVSGRFVQLTPAYDGGRTLPDDATIPASRTVTPVEWNTTVAELTTLAKQLGPGEGEVTGAVGRALDSLHANVKGQGGKLGETARNAADAMTTLAHGRQDLFGTIRNLQAVVSALAENDLAVEAFNEQLADVSSVLAANRDQLGLVFEKLDRSAALIRNFVRDNRRQLTANLAGVAQAADQLAGHRQALADLLQRAPHGVSNFNNVYDPVGSLMAGGFAITMFSDPATFICSMIFQAGGRTETSNKTCEAAITPFAQVLKMNNVPLLTNPLQIAPKDRAAEPEESEGGR